ncbi:MAG: C40 family peptidase [Lachnospiraceae bacterium]|nr:C40 family peptidase [Lachnospiraceae bacterium]
MKLPKRVVACVVACALLGTQFVPAEASNKNNKNNIQQQINKDQNELNKVNNQLSQYEAERDEYLSYLDDQKSEMMNLMKDIVYNEEAITSKTADIAEATAELEEACVLRDEQYAAMMVRIQYMYERGNENYLVMLFNSQDFTDLLNRAEYVDSLYAYDSAMLSDYEQLVADIDTMRSNLETEKAALEITHENLEGQKAELERIMAELEDTISDYDDLVAEAKAKAKAYKDKISKGQAQLAEIKRQEEEAKRKAEEELKRQQALQAQQNGNNSSNSGGSNAVVSGSGTGAEIAQFALNYVGGPYVWGGTSLTNGADCSGFIMSVYANYGYSLPHSSYSMRSIGVGVDLADAQAGDIICYSGHVALYIGNGQIVHAKNSKYGIVTDPVYYGWGGTGPAVLAVRRIIK